MHRRLGLAFAYTLALSALFPLPRAVFILFRAYLTVQHSYLPVFSFTCHP